MTQETTSLSVGHPSCVHWKNWLVMLKYPYPTAALLETHDKLISSGSCPTNLSFRRKPWSWWSPMKGLISHDLWFGKPTNLSWNEGCSSSRWWVGLRPLGRYLLAWDGIHLGAVAPALMATTASRTAAAQAPRSCAQEIPIVIQSWFHRRRP